MIELPHTRRAHWLLLLPALLAIALYLPAINFDFIWDDRELLVRSSSLRNWGGLWHGISQGFLTYRGYFRPLPLLTLGIEQILGDGGSLLPHLDAILIHALNSALVGVLARRVAGQTGQAERAALRAGVLAGLIYACHPALIESVAWISSRFDLLLTTFSLGFLIADRALQRTATRAASMSALFLLAAMCKEMAVALALLLPLWHLLFEPRASWRETLAAFRRRGHFTVYAGIFSTGLFYLYLRQAGLGAVFIAPHSVVEQGSAAHLVFVLKTLGTDARLMLFPFTALSPLHSFAGMDAVDINTWLGVAFAGLCLILAFAVTRGSRGLGLLLLCCMVALLPVSNIVPLQLRDCYTAERFLTLPLVFVVIWATLGITRTLPSIDFPVALKRLCVAMLALFWFGFCLLNLQATLPLWERDLYLWTWAYERVPQSETAQVNLEAAYIDNNLFEKARELCRRSLDEHIAAGIPADAEQYGHYLAALVYTDAPSGLVKPLFATLERIAAQIPSTDARRVLLHNNLGWLYLLRGHPAQAIAHLNVVLTDDPDAPAANFGLAVVQTALHDPAAATSILKARQHASPRVQEKWRAEMPRLVKKAGDSGAYPGDL